MHTFKSLGVDFKHASINGIDFFSFEKANAPIFVSVFFHAGSKYNTKDGVAHFLEHLLVAGSERFTSKNLLAEYIENTGGRFSASTNSDFIRIDLEVAESEDMPVLIDILDQMVNKSSLTASQFEVEKKAILAELVGKKTHQREFAWDVFQKLAFQGTILSKTNLGTERSIQEMSVDDVATFKTSYFSKGKVSVIMAGGIETQEWSEKLARVLGDRTGAPIHAEKAIAIRDQWFAIEPYASKLASFYFGFRTDTQNIKDEACAKICADYLAGGRSSNLITKLRYEHGLVYSVVAINRFLQNGSIFSVRTDCDSDNLKQTLSLIDMSFKELCKNCIASEKLQNIKSKISKSFLIELQTSKSWVVHNERLVTANNGASILDLLSAIHEVSAEDAIQYARKNFSLEKKYLAVCGPSSVVSMVQK